MDTIANKVSRSFSILLPFSLTHNARIRRASSFLYMTIIAASPAPPSFSSRADTHYNGYYYDTGLKRFPKRVSLVKRHTHTGALPPLPAPTRPSPPRQLSDDSPSKKKSVRFSETVEDIKLFYQWQTPDAIRKQQQVEEENDEQDSSDPPRLGMINWVIPSSSSQIEKQISPGTPVAVENMSVQPSTATSSSLKTMTTTTTAISSNLLTLIGHCRVANLAFEKHVMVRCTFDHWTTFKDIDCIFEESIGATDRFAFKIPWSRKARIAELALRYNVNGREFWDNNRGKNYRVRLQTTISSPPEQQLPPTQSLWYQRSSSDITINPLPTSSFWVSTSWTSPTSTKLFIFH